MSLGDRRTLHTREQLVPVCNYRLFSQQFLYDNNMLWLNSYIFFLIQLIARC